MGQGHGQGGRPPALCPGRRRQTYVQKKHLNFRLRFHLDPQHTQHLDAFLFSSIIIFIISATSNQFLYRRCIRDGELSRRSASPSRTSPCLCDLVTKAGRTTAAQRSPWPPMQRLPLLLIIEESKKKNTAAAAEGSPTCDHDHRGIGRPPEEARHHITARHWHCGCNSALPILRDSDGRPARLSVLSATGRIEARFQAIDLLLADEGRRAFLLRMLLESCPFPASPAIGHVLPSARGATCTQYGRATCGAKPLL
ncbi:hypothetical protein B0T18DRAFT_216337 [Schizothecium vesticola]|uniref:Uncharacterized protein n=1 Tax=Schizothecium vesticola TaxID=314040 RepID=A0AA40EK97_9PEZI|nr:hypothetical protein B0T18DRAFT_216337 [Schizothecium vesticola]